MDEIKISASSSMPSFMKKEAERRLAHQMRTNPDFYIKAAMYAANDVSTADRLLLLEEALRLKDIGVLSQWKSEMAIYPEIPLGDADMARTRNPDMPFRAFYLLEAVAKLLEIVDAPEAMTSDLRLFMKARLPYTAVKRAKIQKAIIDNPGWSKTKIAEEFKYDLSRMGDEVDKGQLVLWPMLDDPLTDPDLP